MASRADKRRKAVVAYNKANAGDNAEALASQGLYFGANGEVLSAPDLGGGDQMYATEGGGGGGYEDGGGGGYAPDPALIEALRRLNEEIAPKAMSEITAAEQAWRMRLAQLQQVQSQESAAIAAQIGGDNMQAQQAYGNAVNPILGDLQAQGFSASPIQQQAALDQQRFADYGQRQQDMSARFGQIQNRSFADRDAAATGQMAGARGVLANNLAQMRMELEAEIAAGGGGGGGGGGRGGGGRGGSGGDAPLSILKALAEANTPLADPRNSVNYTGRHRSMVNAAVGRINEDLSNVGNVQRRFIQQARKQGLNKGGFVKGAKQQVFKPLRKAAPAHQKAQAKRNVSRQYVEMWAQS